MRADDAMPSSEHAAEWLTASDIGKLANVHANTVRTWWKRGQLPYHDLTELGAKSFRRSKRSDVEQHIAKRGRTADRSTNRSPQGRREASNPGTQRPAGQEQLNRESDRNDLLATTSSIKAGAVAIMEAMISEAESHAEVLRAHADAAAKRIETLKQLRVALGAYDMALSPHLHPDVPND